MACFHRAAEKAHSRQYTVASPATNIPVDGALSSGTGCSCYLLPRHSHACCEDLLRGATGCCSRVAGELVLYSPARLCQPMHYTGLSFAQSQAPVILFH